MKQAIKTQPKHGLTDPETQKQQQSKGPKRLIKANPETYQQKRP
jgi:hypothetical protein